MGRGDFVNTKRPGFRRLNGRRKETARAYLRHLADTHPDPETLVTLCRTLHYAAQLATGMGDTPDLASAPYGWALYHPPGYGSAAGTFAHMQPALAEVQHCSVEQRVQVHDAYLGAMQGSHAPPAMVPTYTETILRIEGRVIPARPF